MREPPSGAQPDFSGPALRREIISMKLWHVLFGFQGRINRAKWWLSLLIAFILFYVVGSIARVVDAERGKTLLLLLYVVVFVWLSLAASVKRLHDINLSNE